MLCLGTGFYEDWSCWSGAADVSHDEFLPFQLQELPGSSLYRGDDYGDQEIVRICVCAPL